MLISVFQLTLLNLFIPVLSPHFAYYWICQLELLLKQDLPSYLCIFSEILVLCIGLWRLCTIYPVFIVDILIVLYSRRWRRHESRISSTLYELWILSEMHHFIHWAM